jgi:hypothetical protein
LRGIYAMNPQTPPGLLGYQKLTRAEIDQFDAPRGARSLSPLSFVRIRSSLTCAIRSPLFDTR